MATFPPVPTSVKSQPQSSSNAPANTSSTTKSTTNAASTNPAPLLYQAYPIMNEWNYAQNAVAASQPVSKGYDIAATRLSTARRSAALNSTNAILSSPIDGGFQMSLFVTATNIDSALAGTTAQARLTRDFYAHNFIQPTIQCMGLSMGQEDFGLLCEFVHAAQHYAMNNGQGGLVQLFVAGRNNPAPYGTVFDRGFNRNRPSNRGNRKVSVSGSSSGANNGTWWNQNLHGTHNSILAQGYINSMPRQHQQFEYVVEWELDFTVSVILDGIYNDYPGFNSASLLQDSNNNLMAGVQANALSITAALQKKNKAALAYAASNSSNFFPASQTNFGGSGGSGSNSGSSPSVGSVSADAKSIMSVLIAAGMSKAGAAAAVGNMQQESGINPAEAGGGLCQWIGDRWTNLVNYCNSLQLSSNSTQGQLDFMLHELQTGYASLWSELMTTTNVTQATTDFSDTYERPGDPQLQNRINYAQSAYNGYTG
jgi:hypothetical protein